MSEPSYNKVGLIGNGAWGTALGMVAGYNAKEILLYNRSQQAVIELNQTRSSKVFPNVALPESLYATASLAELVEMELVLLVVPAQALRQILQDMQQISTHWPPLVICSKGIELDTQLLLSQVVMEFLPNSQIAVLSGPNFAHEIAQGKLSATVVAAQDKAFAYRVMATLATPYFRPYYSSDVVGLQLVGAAKNIYAIAVGMIEGMKLGENARAAAVARGLGEMAQLCIILGGKVSTVIGLGGVGDLVLSCSLTSRNMSLGYRIGAGEAVVTALTDVTQEGYATTRALYQLATKLQLEMPILAAVYAVLYKGVAPNEALQEVINKPLTEE